MSIASKRGLIVGQLPGDVALGSGKHVLARAESAGPALGRQR
jgi:hypothetical protein